jgi:hypothetical protein
VLVLVNMSSEKVLFFKLGKKLASASHLASSLKAFRPASIVALTFLEERLEGLQSNIESEILLDFDLINFCLDSICCEIQEIYQSTRNSSDLEQEIRHPDGSE